MKKNGQFHPDPSAPPLKDRREAMDGGEFSFIIDPAGVVVGWKDNLTGSSYGEAKTSNKSSQVFLAIMALIVAIAIILNIVR